MFLAAHGKLEDVECGNGGFVFLRVGAEQQLSWLEGTLYFTFHKYLFYITHLCYLPNTCRHFLKDADQNKENQFCVREGKNNFDFFCVSTKQKSRYKLIFPFKKKIPQTKIDFNILLIFWKQVTQVISEKQKNSTMICVTKSLLSI